MGFLALIVVSWATGGMLIRRPPPFRAEAFLYRMLTGLCICSVAIMVVGSASLLAVRIGMATLALGMVVYAGVRARKGDGRRAPLSEVLRLDLTRLESLFLTATLVANGLALLSALAPVTSWDAGVAHLALPSEYAREGRIAFDDGNVYSAYPQLMHSLYAYVFAESGEVSTALLSWMFGTLACLAVYSLGRRVESREVGLISAAIFATSPVFLSQAGTVSIDLAFTGLTIATLSCLFAWHEEKKTHWLVLAGLFVGASCGVRHTGYLVALLTLAGMVAIGKRDRIRNATIYSTVAFAAAAPWLIRSALVAGNPVYPFLRGVFGSERLPDVQTTALLSHESIQGTGLLDFVLFPWTIVMRPEWYDGWTASPGALLLLLGPPGLIIGGAKARWLGAFSLTGGMAFFFFQRLARYILPFFTPMMVVAAVASARLERMRRPIIALLLFTFAYGLVLGTAMIHFKLPVVFGLELPAKYLERRVERYEAFQWVNRNLKGTGTVLTFDPRSYYFDVPTYQNFEMLSVLAPKTIEEQVAWLRANDIRHVFYPEAYVMESPAFAARGFTEVLDRWREDEAHFQLAHVIELPRPGTTGTERVEIYEVLQRREGEPLTNVRP